MVAAWEERLTALGRRLAAGDFRPTPSRPPGGKKGPVNIAPTVNLRLSPAPPRKRKRCREDSRAAPKRLQ